MKKFFLFVYPLLLAIQSLGQEMEDTTLTYDDSKKIKQFQHFKKGDFWNDTIPSNVVDSTLDNFFYYSPQFYNFKMNLGNNGTAQRNLYFKPNSLAGFKTNFDQLHDFKFTYQNNEYYDVSQPYARVFYINGAQKEEGINIAFSQNISKNWNIGIEYKKVGSEGFYQRQRTAINSFRVFQSFKTKNNRYAILANLNYNDNSNEENGGIKYDTVFTDFPDFSRKGIEVNYSQAKNSGRNQEYYLEHQLNFGREKTFYYTDENDSIHKDSIIGQWIAPLLSPFHAIRYNHAEYHYDDVSTSPENYPPGTASLGGNINEYLSTKALDNRAGLKFYPLRNNKLFNKLEIAAFGEFQYLEYFQSNHFIGTVLNEKYYTNSIIGISASNYHQGGLAYGLENLNVLEGFDAGDQILKGYVTYSKPKFKVSALAENSILNPKLFYRDYLSTTYTWNRVLDKTQTNFIEGKLILPQWGFGIKTNYRSVLNHTYLNSNLEVLQYNQKINIWQTHFNQHIRIWKFHLDLNLRYQWIDQAGIINLPEWLGYGKFYLESRMFKNELLYRIGMDLYANASYTADGYNPVIRHFYSQSNTELETVPWGEFYIMANVDRTYFFVRVSNVFEGAIPYNYFASPGYPLPDRALKLGIKWEFVN